MLHNKTDLLHNRWALSDSFSILQHGLVSLCLHQVNALRFTRDNVSDVLGHLYKKKKVIFWVFEICLYHVQVFLLNLKKLNKAILQSLTIKEHQSKIRRKCRFDSLTVPSHKTFRAGGVILLLSTKLTSLHICSFLTKKKKNEVSNQQWADCEVNYAHWRRYWVNSFLTSEMAHQGRKNLLISCCPQKKQCYQVVHFLENLSPFVLWIFQLFLYISK